jgi:hypothetical protein
MEKRSIFRAVESIRAEFDPADVQRRPRISGLLKQPELLIGVGPGNRAMLSH